MEKSEWRNDEIAFSPLRNNTYIYLLIRTIMKSKLTLSISEHAIKKGKKYALLQNKSVSEIVEEYFQSMLIESSKDSEEFSIFGCLSNQFEHEPSDEELKDILVKDKK